VIRTVLGRIARKQGDVDRARELLSTAFEAGLEDADPLIRSVFHPQIELGALERACEAYGAATSQLETALECAREAGDPHRTAACSYQLGVLAHATSDDDEARTYLESALENYQQVGDRYGIATVRRRQGIIAHEQGEQDLARSRWRHALDAFDDVRAFAAARDTAEGLLDETDCDDPDRLREWAASARSIPE
jgi:tetratricopeptide (TPR) repeat protein